VGLIVQVGGALLVLAAYGLLQTGVLHHRSLSYTALNADGAAILAIDAYNEQQWGFLLLEGVWALIAVGALARAPQPARKPLI
jgi:hypothetical protein